MTKTLALYQRYFLNYSNNSVFTANDVIDFTIRDFVNLNKFFNNVLKSIKI